MGLLSLSPIDMGDIVERAVQLLDFIRRFLAQRCPSLSSDAASEIRLAGVAERFNGADQQTIECAQIAQLFGGGIRQSVHAILRLSGGRRRCSCFTMQAAVWFQCGVAPLWTAHHHVSIGSASAGRMS
jgi:hypothetical protein